MSTDAPRPERVTLTAEERQHTYEHFAYSDDNDDVEEMHLGKCLLVEDFESILAAREQALREEIEQLRAGINGLAVWHEVKAEKARIYRVEINGRNAVMDKAADVHADASRRLRNLADR